MNDFITGFTSVDMEILGEMAAVVVFILSMLAMIVLLFIIGFYLCGKVFK